MSSSEIHFDRSQLTLRAPTKMRSRLAEAATFRGLSLNSFVLQAAVREADEILKQERHLQITASDARKILGLLENPPKPNAALTRAFARRKKLLNASR